MDITAKMEISISSGGGGQQQQQFVPSACFFASGAAAAQSAQLSPSSGSSGSSGGGKSSAAAAAASHQKQQQRGRQRAASPELLRCKRRLSFAGFGYSLPAATAPPHAVARRNERERNRVKLVNSGFATLREHVPGGGGGGGGGGGAANKKMSKVETLRSAVEYIRALQQLLDEHDAVSAAFRSGALSPAMSQQHYPDDMNSMAGSSPVSSYSSECEGSYGALSPEEQELLDFTSWF